MDIKPASALTQVSPTAKSTQKDSIKFQATCSKEENEELEPTSPSECTEPETTATESVGLAKHLMVHSCTQCELCECKRLDKSRCNPQRHLHLREKPVRCRNCGCQSLPETYFAQTRSGANGGFVCGMCSFQSCSLGLNEHATDEADCGASEATFEQKSLLQQYIEKKLFECGACSYKTISKAKLERHKLLLHVDEKNPLDLGKKRPPSSLDVNACKKGGKFLGLAPNKKGLSTRVAVMLRNKILSRRLHHGAL